MLRDDAWALPTCAWLATRGQFAWNHRLVLSLFVSAAALATAGSTEAQDVNGADAQLPEVTVETTASEPPAQPKKKSKKAAAAPPKPAKAPPQAPVSPAEDYEPVEADGAFPFVGSTGGAGGGGGGRVGTSGVDGYLATRSSTATKTDTPLLDTPQSITVVPKELAKDQGAKDLRSALSYVPGVVVGQGEGHRDAPTIRGVSTTADFFIDGVRDDVQYFRDLYNVDVVEVLRGPNAMIFGRGGGGGVINRVTEKADFERNYEVTATYGSFDTKRVDVDAGQAVSPNMAVRLNAMYEDSGSYRDFVDLERFGINPKMTLLLDPNTRVRLAYEYFSDERTVDRGIPSDFLTGKPAKTDPSTFFGNPDESYMDFASHLATATIEHVTDNGIRIKNHTQAATYDKFYQNVFANSALNDPANPRGTIKLGAYNSDLQRDAIFNQTDVTARVEQGGGIAHTLLAGVELGYQQTDTQRDPTSGNYPVPLVDFSDPVTDFVPPWGTNPGPLNHTEVGVAGVYAQDQLAIGRYIDVIGGIRFDHFNVDYTNETTGEKFDRVDNVFSPRVGVVFKPTEPLSLYVSYAKSFLPSTGEQFSSLSGGVTGTSNLAPEEFLNREIGFKWEVTPRLVFTGALFQLDRENQFVTTAAGEVGQLGKTRTEGGELTLTGHMTEAWEVVAGYSYQRAEVLVGTAATLGKEVPLVPHNLFSLWNKYRFLPQWAAGVGVISRSEMFASIANDVTLPGFARLDAALFWDISDNLKAQLNVENVLDTEYYATAHNDNNITPGSPQAFYVTVTSSF
ncbi:MAG: TonB-dependent receptor [Hyphomicrobium sp.]